MDPVSHIHVRNLVFSHKSYRSACFSVESFSFPPLSKYAPNPCILTKSIYSQLLYFSTSFYRLRGRYCYPCYRVTLWWPGSSQSLFGEGFTTARRSGLVIGEVDGSIWRGKFYVLSVWTQMPWAGPCGIGSGPKGQRYWTSANSNSGQVGLRQFAGMICEASRTIQCEDITIIRIVRPATQSPIRPWCTM